VSPRIRVLDWGPDPLGKGHSAGGMCRPTYLRWVHSLLFACRRGRMFLPNTRGGQMHSSPRGLQHGDAAFCYTTLHICC